MKLVDYDRLDDYYLIVFNVNFKLLSDKKTRVLKKAKIVVTADDYILVIADKRNAGVLISELLEENVVSLYPQITVFRLIFDITALREAGILSRLAKKLEDVPVLSFFTVGPEVYLVVRRDYAEKVNETIFEVFESRTLQACNRSFWRIPYTPGTSS